MDDCDDRSKRKIPLEADCRIDEDKHERRKHEHDGAGYERAAELRADEIGLHNDNLVSAERIVERVCRS